MCLQIATCNNLIIQSPLTVGDSVVLFAFLFFLILCGAPAMSLM